MKRMLTAAAAVATIAVVLAGTATSADAYWRRGWGWGPGLAAGLVGGAIIGGAIASSAAPPYYYGGYPAYGPGPGCYIQRERFWDGWGWRIRPVRVCY